MAPTSFAYQAQSLINNSKSCTHNQIGQLCLIHLHSHEDDDEYNQLVNSSMNILLWWTTINCVHYQQQQQHYCNVLCHIHTYIYTFIVHSNFDAFNQTNIQTFHLFLYMMMMWEIQSKLLFLFSAWNAWNLSSIK